MLFKKLGERQIFSESQESCVNISWSSTESETENFELKPPTKRLKPVTLAENSYPNNWINLRINLDQTPTKEEEDQLLVESPIITGIGGFNKNESPILSQMCLDKPQSPIIRRSSIIRRIKWHHKLNKRSAIEDQDSDSETDSRLFIENSSQPSNSKTQIVISPVKSEFSYRIGSISSQESSEVVPDSSSSVSDPQFCHQPTPKTKKYKKGGLAHQLQKALNLQNSRTAIWQHEVFLSKSKNKIIKESSDDIEFFVLKKWEEYESTLFKCKFNSDINSLKKQFMFHDDLVSNLDFFILITTCNYPIKVIFEENKTYKVFTPYSIKIILYEKKQTLCMVDATRFLAL